jgi:hypothetical protein
VKGASLSRPQAAYSPTVTPEAVWSGPTAAIQVIPRLTRVAWEHCREPFLGGTLAQRLSSVPAGRADAATRERQRIERYEHDFEAVCV